MIEVQKINYWIRDHQILKDVSLTVPAGETAVVIGPSGSGKSTLLRIILGLVKPDSGRVLIDGVELTGTRSKSLAELRKQIGMVFQDGALFSSLTVGENVGYYLFEHTRMASTAIEQAVRQTLEIVGLDTELIDALPDTLSGGMQRRVAIARALAAQSTGTHEKVKVMLYDEPTTGLDPISVEMVTECILNLKKKLQLASIVVTHEIADALKIGNWFLVLNEGEVVFRGTPDELAETRQPFVQSFLLPFRETLAQAALHFKVGGNDD